MLNAPNPTESPPGNAKPFRPTWRDPAFRCGLLMTGFGAIGMALSLQLPLGTLARPGNGALPMVAALVSTIAGLATMAGTKAGYVETTDGTRTRPVVATLGSALAFAGLLHFADLALACIAAAAAGAFAIGVAWYRVALIGVVVGMLGYAIFGLAFAVR